MFSLRITRFKTEQTWAALLDFVVNHLMKLKIYRKYSFWSA